jgi:hypothetical protein
MGYPASCSSSRGEALEGEQFSPGFGAIFVELEHLFLEVVDDIGSCIFPVKLEACFVSLSCRFNIAKSVDIFGGTMCNGV